MKLRNEYGDVEPWAIFVIAIAVGFLPLFVAVII